MVRDPVYFIWRAIQRQFTTVLKTATKTSYCNYPNVILTWNKSEKCDIMQWAGYKPLNLGAWKELD